MLPDEREQSADYNKTSFLALLLQKLSYAILVGGENGAAANEVMRQIILVSRRNGGNPINGDGVTKSTDRDEDL